jgi:hypothetical protein
MNNEQIQQQINALQAHLNQSRAQIQRAQDDRDMSRCSATTGINPLLEDPFSMLSSPSVIPIQRPQFPASPAQVPFVDSPEHSTQRQFNQGRTQICEQNTNI